MTNGDNNSKFFLFKDQNKNKIKKYKKRNNFYTEKSIKSTFGVRLFVVCTVHLYRRSTFARFGSNHSAAVKNKALRKHKL